MTLETLDFTGVSEGYCENGKPEKLGIYTYFSLTSVCNVSLWKWKARETGYLHLQKLCGYRLCRQWKWKARETGYLHTIIDFISFFPVDKWKWKARETGYLHNLLYLILLNLHYSENGKPEKLGIYTMHCLILKLHESQGENGKPEKLGIYTPSLKVFRFSVILVKMESPRNWVFTQILNRNHIFFK